MEVVAGVAAGGQGQGVVGEGQALAAAVQAALGIGPGVARVLLLGTPRKVDSLECSGGEERPFSVSWLGRQAELGAQGHGALVVGGPLGRLL